MDGHVGTTIVGFNRETERTQGHRVVTSTCKPPADPIE